VFRLYTTPHWLKVSKAAIPSCMVGNKMKKDCNDAVSEKEWTSVYVPLIF
jgi:hypothetical protein